MLRTNVLTLALGVMLSTLLVPLSASAQQAQASGIAGVVKDASGAVLPGVTVEAASPALIEKVRTVVTDGEGRYNIVDLRPGSYTVTFSITGFNAFRRDGERWAFDGTLHDARGKPIELSGLWGIAFGNGAMAGDARTLFFTSGPHVWRGETELGVHGLLGSIAPA